MVELPPAKLTIGEHPAIRVRWIDSGMHLDHGWADKNTYTKDINPATMTVDTIGILMYRDDDITMVGLSYDAENENWMGAQVVLNKNILEVQML